MGAVTGLTDVSPSKTQKKTQSSDVKKIYKLYILSISDKYTWSHLSHNFFSTAISRCFPIQQKHSKTNINSVLNEFTQDCAVHQTDNSDY